MSSLAFTRPILYSFRRCPYAMRARMALWSSGLTVELREVVLGRKPAALLEASPKGTVPVLDLGVGGGVIEQSLEIVHWALNQSDPECWLSGDRDLCLKLIFENDGDFKKNLDHYKYPDRHGGSGDEARTAGISFLRRLEVQLELTVKGFLMGSTFTVADAAIFPFIRQFASVDKEWFDALPLPRLRAWLALCLATDVFKQIMLRFDEWKPGSEVVLWGRALSSLKKD